MKILIAGSSGLIGTALKDFLQTQSHKVTPLLRREGAGVFWNPKKNEITLADLEGYDAFIWGQGSSRQISIKWIRISLSQH